MPEETAIPERHEGVVRIFYDQLGYGFIDLGMNHPIRDDLFVHHTAIQMDGHRTLHPDQRVEFEIGEDRDHRPIAKKVIVLAPKIEEIWATK